MLVIFAAALNRDPHGDGATDSLLGRMGAGTSTPPPGGQRADAQMAVVCIANWRSPARRRTQGQPFVQAPFGRQPG